MLLLSDHGLVTLQPEMVPCRSCQEAFQKGQTQAVKAATTSSRNGQMQGRAAESVAKTAPLAVDGLLISRNFVRTCPDCRRPSSSNSCSPKSHT